MPLSVAEQIGNIASNIFWSFPLMNSSVADLCQCVCVCVCVCVRVRFKQWFIKQMFLQVSEQISVVKNDVMCVRVDDCK